MFARECVAETDTGMPSKAYAAAAAASGRLCMAKIDLSSLGSVKMRSVSTSWSKMMLLDEL
ncbi:hypothetical protein Plhal304r1_c029g0094261 [Plasmopara halstedii]